MNIRTLTFKLTFYHPNLPPSLNGANGLIRSHWAKRKKIKEDFIYEILSFKPPRMLSCKVILYYYYCGVPMDWDNLASRFKIIGDSLKSIGAIDDDNPKFITDFQMRQTRVAKRKDSRLEIIFDY